MIRYYLSQVPDAVTVSLASVLFMTQPSNAAEIPMISIGIREPDLTGSVLEALVPPKLLRTPAANRHHRTLETYPTQATTRLFRRSGVPDGTVGSLLGCESGLSIVGVLGGSPTIAAAAPGSSGREPVADPSTLVTISDVQSIVAEGGTINVSPNRGWVYVNKPVYFESDAVGYDEDLTVLGNAVTVHLTRRVLHMGSRRRISAILQRRCWRSLARWNGHARCISKTLRRYASG